MLVLFLSSRIVSITDALKTLLKTAKNTHDLVWELTFNSATDMRPSLFDFAQEHQLRTLQIVLKSKNLEQIFREKTGKK